MKSCLYEIITSNQILSVFWYDWIKDITKWLREMNKRNSLVNIIYCIFFDYFLPFLLETFGVFTKSIFSIKPKEKQNAFKRSYFLSWKPWWVSSPVDCFLYDRKVANTCKKKCYCGRPLLAFCSEPIRINPRPEST